MKKNVTDWNIDCRGDNEKNRQNRRGDNEKNRQNRRRGSGYPAGERAAALLVSGILFCAAVLTGCSGSGSGGNKGTDAGDKEITVAINSETGTLDPAGSIALTYLAYSVSALDELLTFDENGEIEYRAADSYEVNEDSTEWTFHLREDALWSDGTRKLSVPDRERGGNL